MKEEDGGWRMEEEEEEEEEDIRSLQLTGGDACTFS